MITTRFAIPFVLTNLLLDDEHIKLLKAVGVIIALIGVMLLIIHSDSGLPDFIQINPIGFILVFTG
jgi:drug/metabolite transporter (DMT)-like permease